MPPFSTLLPLVRDLLFLRRGPQDLPYSPSLLALLIGATLVLDAVLAAHIVQIGVPRMAFSLLLLALTWIALRMGEKDARFVQTATALLGAGLLLTLLEIPVLMGLSGIAPDAKQLTPPQSLALGLALLFLIWEIAVAGHILRHALDLRMRFGVLMAIVFFTIDRFAALLLFERPAG